MNDGNNELIDDDDDDDDFFGSQDDAEGDVRNEFGRMGDQEFLARENELRNIGFVDAYDEHKESRLQEGFESGFQETYEVSILLGKLLGEITTLERLKERSLAGSNSQNNSSSSVTPPSEPVVQSATSLVRDFFVNKFQKESNNARQDLELLLHDIQALLKQEDHE